MPDNVRQTIEANLVLVNLAVKTGIILNIFPFEDEKLDNLNLIVIETLARFLTYRVPQLRGNNPPYAED